jgi:tetratricopeptide (TPR) repeat protein
VGWAAEAIAQFEQSLAGRVRVLGPGHPDTLASRNNLGHAYQEAGRVPEAIALFEQALAAGTRVLGPGHPTTVSSRVNLAGAYRDAGL